MKTKLLHIALGNHNKGLWKSFDKHFDTIHYDWKPNRLDPTLINKEIAGIVQDIGLQTTKKVIENTRDKIVEKKTPKG